MTVERGKLILGGLLTLGAMSGIITGQLQREQFMSNAVVALIGMAIVVWPKGVGKPKG